jgi:putative oxidoreductase
MTDISTEPKLLLPGLAPLYRHVVPLSWLVVRCAAGLILFYHGTGKIGHIDAVTANMVKNGIVPPMLFAYVVTLTETVAAFCVAIGFFTRFFAAACAIDLAVITFHVLWPKGFGWSQGGYEFMLMWGLITFAIALRGGGGPYSVDRWIGREL